MNDSPVRVGAQRQPAMEALHRSAGGYSVAGQRQGSGMGAPLLQAMMATHTSGLGGRPSPHAPQRAQQVAMAEQQVAEGRPCLVHDELDERDAAWAEHLLKVSIAAGFVGPPNDARSSRMSGMQPGQSTVTVDICLVSVSWPSC